jgi:serine/threonine-protein kinase
MGHFELVEYIGGGGMGRVFRAIDTQLARTVALKVLPPDQAVDSDSLQRFQNEAQSAARLDHENIARVYCIGEDRGLHFIAFEYIDGINIRSLVEQKGPLSLVEAISYTLQASEALAHSDARAVVHRDIKPSNLLITPEGRVKLIDMGLARLRLVDSSAADLTASGVTLGTFDYISPEQARDPRNADIRSDIYSLGCTLFFMLTGQPPFPDGTVLQKLLQHQGDEPPDVRQFRPDLPEEVGRILRKMMAKDPRRRYANPVELVSELLVFSEQIGLRRTNPSNQVWMTPELPHVSFFRRHLPWIAPIAALVCIVIALDWYWSWASSVSPQNDMPSSFDSSKEGFPNPADAKGPLPNKKTEAPLSASPPTGSSLQKNLDSKGTELNSSKFNSQLETNGNSASMDAASGKSKTTKTLEKTDSSSLNTGQPSSVFDKPSDSTSPTFPSVLTSPSVVNNEDINVPPRENVNQGTPASSTATPVEVADLQGHGNPSSLNGEGASRVAASDDKPSNVLVVGDHAIGEMAFDTLAAACAAANDGSIIELRYSGARPPESPIKLANVQITIRAGKGYRPVVVFQPNETDLIKHLTSMITLTSKRLTLVDVAMELVVPRHVAADNWSLFETHGDSTIRVEHCDFSIQNASDLLTAYYPNVAFFRAISSTESEGVLSNPLTAPPLATLELTDSIARGEAIFLRVENMQPVRLSWNNGLLVTTEQLLYAEGGQATPKPDEMLWVDLRHVTVVAQGGLCRLICDASTSHQYTAQFTCTEDVFVGVPGVPLIQQDGEVNTENARQHLVWNGNENYYENIDLLWMIRGPDLEINPDKFNVDAWKAYWQSRENQPHFEHLSWQKAIPANRPLHTHGPADYTLISDAANGVPGAQVFRLPSTPD